MIFIYDKNGVISSFENNIITSKIKNILDSNKNYKYLISTHSIFPPPNMNFEEGELIYKPYDELVSLGFVNPDQNPYPHLPYYVYNKELEKWNIDENLLNQYNLKLKEIEYNNKKLEIQKLLLESDYIELPSFIERKGQEIYNLWMTYRANLRLAYHNSELPIPEKPE